MKMEVVDPMMAEVLRQKSPAERLQIACGMWRSARTMLTHLVRAEHADWSEQRVLEEVARRLADGTG